MSITSNPSPETLVAQLGALLEEPARLHPDHVALLERYTTAVEANVELQAATVAIDEERFQTRLDTHALDIAQAEKQANRRQALSAASRCGDPLEPDEDTLERAAAFLTWLELAE